MGIARIPPAGPGSRKEVSRLRYAPPRSPERGLVVSEIAEMTHRLVTLVMLVLTERHIQAALALGLSNA